MPGQGPGHSALASTWRLRKMAEQRMRRSGSIGDVRPGSRSESTWQFIQVSSGLIGLHATRPNSSRDCSQSS
jgi:hypothetical protein